MKVIHLLLVVLVSIAIISLGIAGYAKEINELAKKGEEIKEKNEQIEKIGEESKKMTWQIEKSKEELEKTKMKLESSMSELAKTNEELAKKDKPISIEINGTKVSAEELKNLTKEIGIKDFDIADSYYFSVPLAVIEEILANNSINRMEYINESRDCDDFALMLAGHFSQAYSPHPAIGIIHGMCGINGHAWNAVLADEGIYYIEPQTDEIARPKDFNCTAGSIFWN